MSDNRQGNHRWWLGTVRSAIGTMARTTDGRTVRHAVARIDRPLADAGWSEPLRARYIAACQAVADTIAGRASSR